MDRSESLKMLDIVLVEDLLHDFVTLCAKGDTGLVMNRMLRFLFQTKKKSRFSSGLYQHIILVIIATINDGNASPFSTEQRQLVSNVLECLYHHMAELSTPERTILLDELLVICHYKNRVHPHTGQILVHLFDYFVRDLDLEKCLQLLKLIQHLVESQEKNDRHAAYCLMHKLEEIFDTNIAIANALKCTKEQLSLYIAIMEHLEKQQMHPQLNDFMVNLNSSDTYFLKVTLYRMLLQCENISIVYETMKFVRKSFNSILSPHYGLIDDFLKATNRVELYNFDDARSYPLLKDFLRDDQMGVLLCNLVKVPFKWNDIPFYEWMMNINREKRNTPWITTEILLDLASVVKSMETENLCCELQEVMFDRFSTTISKLNLSEYLTFIEVIYANGFGNFQDHNNLASKIESCHNFETHIPSFKKSIKDLIFNRFDRYLYKACLLQFQQLPKEIRGCLRFFVLNGIGAFREIGNFYSTLYEVDLDVVLHDKNFKQLQEHLLDKLNCETSEEQALALELSVDIFVECHIEDWNDIERFQLKPVELLEQGGSYTFIHLAKLLDQQTRIEEDHVVLSAFAASLQKSRDYSAVANIGKYAYQHLSIERQSALSVEILSNNKNKSIIEGILKSCIEVPPEEIVNAIGCYALGYKDTWFIKPRPYARTTFHWLIKYTLRKPWSYIKEVGDKLIHINLQMSKEHKTCLTLSAVHRVQFFNALALLFLAKKLTYSDKFWEALFTETNQINITCIYELIIGKTLPSFELLLERLHSISLLTPNQKLSLLSVINIYGYYKFHCVEPNQLKQIFDFLMTLINEDDSQMRTFANCILDNLALLCRCFGADVPIEQSVLESIKNELQNTTVETQINTRILVHKIFHNMNELFDQPFAYCFCMSNIKPEGIVSDSFKSIRDAFKKAYFENEVKEKLEITIPSNRDLYPAQNINISPDLIVVAILLDKASILNAIVDACKALGVRTLVTNDSANLRSREGDSLKIVPMKLEALEEYLSQQRIKNYNIVATENTSNNLDFVNFSFAYRTVLIFGNDEDSIPENLNDSLHNTVRLPHYDFEHSQKLMILKFNQQYADQQS